MVNPTLTVTLSRGSSNTLECSAADDGTVWGITGFQEPQMQARIRYADSAGGNLHGSVPLAASWQQAMLGLDLTPKVATEAELQAAVADLKATLGQFAYTATIRINGAPATVWSCNMGSFSQRSGRTLQNLEDLNPEYAVTIPVYPIQGA